ncbi:MAG: M15 family metallopeptidase [Ruminococcaceae bacterium]|nr:M15 family metallopeptidase [Oscillospiraceae bacterium]
MKKSKLAIISIVLGLILLFTAGCFLMKMNEEETIEDSEMAESNIVEESDVEDPEVPEIEVQKPEENEDADVEEAEESFEMINEDGCTYIIKDGVKFLIVNKVYPIPADFGSPNEEANDSLNKMISAASEEGIYLNIISSFRDYETQEVIYNRYVSQWGREYTDTVSARPGHSEHQTGLAFDLNSLSSSFEETKEFAWLYENCSNFGFILRYPKGSEWATGYSYEPWHYRYIGDVDFARAVMQSGVSLEEYIGLAKEGYDSGYVD